MSSQQLVFRFCEQEILECYLKIKGRNGKGICDSYI